MIHTAELITNINYWEFEELCSRPNARIYKGDKRFTCIVGIYDLAIYGIKEIRGFRQQLKGGCEHWCKIVVNLARIADNGRQTTKLFTATHEEMSRLYENFGVFMGKVLPDKCNLSKWVVQRIDYTIDIKTPHVQNYINLLQKGGKPRYTHIANREQKKAEMKKTHYPYGVRYESKSLTVNIYNKEEERKQDGANDRILEESKNILRIEIQCKKRKTKYIRRKNGFESNNIYPYLYTRKEAQEIILYNLKEITLTGDYYTGARVEKIINNANLHKTTKEILIKCIKEINLKYKSVWKFKKANGNDKQYRAIIEKLKRMKINPVTIPRSWGIESLQNITELVKGEML